MVPTHLPSDMPLPCSFDDLKKRDGPPLNTWGLWGKDNELGQLNLIDAAAVKRGRDAVKHGIPVCLKCAPSPSHLTVACQ